MGNKNVKTMYEVGAESMNKKKLRDPCAYLNKGARHLSKINLSKTEEW